MTDVLQVTLILLAVAVGVVVLCRLFHLPVMLGYLIVGILIGPHSMGWIPDTPRTRNIAEFGVVFLMFSIGLEFSLARLRAMQREVFGLGAAQVAATMLLVMLASLALGLDWRAGLALGGVLAMSSTAIVSKLLVERAELNTPHGQNIMGVLLFQDLAVVPLIILIPALSSGAEGLPAVFGAALVKALIILTALLTFGQRLLRPWFHLVARQKSTELFMINVLLFTLGLAWVTRLAGLSLALGAFVAGRASSGAGYSHQGGRGKKEARGGPARGAGRRRASTSQRPPGRGSGGDVSACSPSARRPASRRRRTSRSGRAGRPRGAARWRRVRAHHRRRADHDAALDGAALRRPAGDGRRDAGAVLPRRRQLDLLR